MKIRVTIEEDAKIWEIPDEELEGLTNEERRTLLEEEAGECMREMIDWSWAEVK